MWAIIIYGVDKMQQIARMWKEMSHSGVNCVLRCAKRQRIEISDAFFRIRAFNEMKVLIWSRQDQQQHTNSM